MRIHRLHVSRFRGIEDRRLDLAPSGVTVVVGPNETGKSSLAEALNLLFEYPDSSQAEAVRSVQPVGRDVGAEVEVEAETGPYRFRYRKRFHRDRETILEVLEPAPEELTGRDAHDRMTAILDETLDRALWDALWVEQGRGFDQADLARARSLLDALDRAAGGDSGGGEREETLFARIEETVREFYTAKRGTETGALRDARQAAEEAREREDRLADELAELEADAERFDRLESRRRKLEPRVEAARRETDEASEAQGRVRKMRDEVTALRRELDLREGRLERLRDAYDAERAEAELAPRLRAAREELRHAEGAHAPLRDAVEIARNRSDAADGERELRRRDVDLLDRRNRLERTRRELDAARVSRDRLVDLTERLAELPIGVDDVERIDRLERRIREAEAARAAGSPEIRLRAETTLTVELEARDEPGETVSLDPDELWSRRPSRGLALRIPGVAKIELSPGDEAQKLARSVDALRLELHAAVEGILEGSIPEDASPSPDLVRERYAERRRLEDERSAVQAELSRALDGRQQADLERREEKLEEAIAAYLDERPDEPPPADDPDAAREAHQAAETRSQEAQRERIAAERAEREIAEREDKIRRTVERLEMELEAVRERAAQARERLLSRGELPKAAPASEQGALFEDAPGEDPLVEALAAAERARDDARRRLAERERELSEADPENVAARASRAEERFRDLERARNELDRELTELRGRLEALGSRGLFEQHEEAAAALERTTRRLASIEARARAARRLYDTMFEVREEARRSYHRPLADKIAELGRRLYGDDFEVRLSEDLAIAERVLDGRRLPFDQLSTGAREQLALLARLASALLVAPDGGGAPLILDDVLGHTDPDRLVALCRILATTGEACQVVILTSDPQRYRDVEGARWVEMGG